MCLKKHIIYIFCIFQAINKSTDVITPLKHFMKYIRFYNKLINSV